MTENVVEENYRKLVVKTWTDADYKTRLKNNPREALKELGIEIPGNVAINILENSESTLNIVLPEAPSEGELSAADLENVAAGGAWLSASAVL